MLIIFEGFSILHVFAAQAELSAVCPGSVNIGRSFDVTVSMNGSADIDAIQFSVSYDRNYLSFKSASAVQSGELSTYDENGKLGVIFLKNGVIEKGDLITLSFTAKTGNSSSRQKISFEFVEAVDSGFNDKKIGMTDSVSIDIIKASDSSKSGSSKSAGSVTSKKSTSDSKDSEYSSTDSQENFSHQASDGAEGSEGIEEKFSGMGYGGTVVSRSGDYFRESVSESNDGFKYVIFGVSGTLAFVLVGAVCYRMGKGKDNVVPEDENSISETERLFIKYWDGKQ